MSGIPQMKVELMHEDVVRPVFDVDGYLEVYSRENVLLLPHMTHVFKLGLRLEKPRHVLHNFGYGWEYVVRPPQNAMPTINVGMVRTTPPDEYSLVQEPELGIVVTNARSPYTKQVTDIYGNVIDAAYVAECVAVNRPVDGSCLIRKGEVIARIMFQEVVRPIKILLTSRHSKKAFMESIT